jgi:hypothetical protein
MLGFVSCGFVPFLMQKSHRFFGVVIVGVNVKGLILVFCKLYIVNNCGWLYGLISWIVHVCDIFYTGFVLSLSFKYNMVTAGTMATTLAKMMGFESIINP